MWNCHINHVVLLHELCGVAAWIMWCCCMDHVVLLHESCDMSGVLPQCGVAA
jgi:hypothetical protein